MAVLSVGRPVVFVACVAVAALNATLTASADSLADRLKAVQSGQADSVGKLPPWKPVGPDAYMKEIPLVQGLAVLSAFNESPQSGLPVGDYEAIKYVMNINASGVQIFYSADLPKKQLNGPLFNRPADLGRADPMLAFPDRLNCMRVIDVADLTKAMGYSDLYCESPDEHFSGSTSIGASSELLARLRAGQAVDFHFAKEDKWAVYAQQGAQIDGQKPSDAPLTKYAGQMMSSCQLRRVGSTDVAVPVLLNGQRVLLPALHASCTTADKSQADFFWLDQPANAITLAFQLDQAYAQTTQINVPPPVASSTAAPQPAAIGSIYSISQIEQALADGKPVPLYSFYFEFNTANIKAVTKPGMSSPVTMSELILEEIALIAQRHPDWKLGVTGYTDNLADAQASIALSRRRAAAVKDALVSRYKVAADRLITSGNGAAQPIDTNDTLEGRARNRRIEIRRL